MTGTAFLFVPTERAANVESTLGMPPTLAILEAGSEQEALNLPSNQNQAESKTNGSWPVWKLYLKDTVSVLSQRRRVRARSFNR